MEDALGSEDFGDIWVDMTTSLMMTKKVLLKGYPNEEIHQGTPDSPEIDEIIYNSDKERTANLYDQYIGDEVVLPDYNGDKLMGKVRNLVIFDVTSTRRGNYNATHDKSLYEV